VAAKLPKPIHQFLGRFVVHEAQHVIVAPVGAAPVAQHGASPDKAAGCVVVESLQELEAIASEIPPAFSLEKLRRAIEPRRILMLARRPGGPGRAPQVVGYRLCERGVLKSSLGLNERIPDSFLFIHYAEVLPEYRGQRIAELLRECSHRFAARRNIAWTCGVVSLGNAPSLAAHLRPGPATGPIVVATIHKLSFFGGRFALRTPWRRVAKALNELAASRKTFGGHDVSLESRGQ
jgi:ribosomal protein S18 acetylase RimI-like enzyme